MLVWQEASPSRDSPREYGISRQSVYNHKTVCRGDAHVELLLPAADWHLHHRRAAELDRLFAFLTVAIIASNLSAAAQDRAREAIARRNEVTRLFDLTRDVLLTTETASAIEALARHVAHRFELSGVAICLPDDHGWRILQGGQEEVAIDVPMLNSAMATAEAR